MNKPFLGDVGKIRMLVVSVGNLSFNREFLTKTSMNHHRNDYIMGMLITYVCLT